MKAQNLISGNTKSCGCTHRRRGLAHPNATHALSKTAEHRVWSGMKFRCGNPKSKSYKDYGGRGIAVCERWQSFANFLADMGRRPQGTTIDRINNDGNYEPGNCRWATRDTQARNRRGTILSVEQAEEVRQQLIAGAPQRALARQIGVTRSVVQVVWKRLRRSNGPP